MIAAVAGAIAATLVGSLLGSKPAPVAAPTVSAGCAPIGTDASVGHERLEEWIRKTGEHCWATSVSDLRQGDKVDVQLHYSNGHGAAENNVILSSIIPNGYSLVSGSTIVRNATHPDGLTLDARSEGSSINIGNYDPHANAWVKFTLQKSEPPSASCENLIGVPISAQIASAHGIDSAWVSSVIVNTAGCP